MKIQLKRSSTTTNGAAKAPTSGQMDYGDLAVNFAAEDPAIFVKDSNDNIIRISSIGMPDTNDPNEQPGTLDDRYINRAGDAMTGFLGLHADPTAAMHAATKQYVDQEVADIDIPAAPDIGVAPPTGNITDGQFWWDKNDGRLYI